LLTTGDDAPNLIAGDLGSNLIRSLHREETDEWGPMPPSKPLKEEWIVIFERWVLAGMPETPADLPTPTPTEGSLGQAAEATLEPGAEGTTEPSVTP